MTSTSRSGAFTLARWALIVAGVVVTTVGFVGLMIAENLGRGRSPWWIFGVVGLVAVVLALGSPWKARASGD